MPRADQVDDYRVGSSAVDGLWLGSNQIWTPPASGPPLLDDFNRADNASIGTTNWSVLGSGSLAAIESNMASTTSSSGNRQQVWKTATGSNDNGAYVILGERPPTPGSTLFNWVVLYLRMNG